MKNIDIAILLIAFNRPDAARKVLECIRFARPTRLYIAADGPRINDDDDVIACQLVRALKDEIDWDCSVKTLYSTTNLGCKNGVVAAIDWFFEHEEEGIILEDDILPCQAFFSYCHIMLEKYRLSTNIKAILGFNYFGQGVKSNSYFFYEGFYPWGWATWRRSWLEYSAENFDTEIFKVLKGQSVAHRNLYNSLELNLSLIKAGILDTWDYQFMYMLVKTRGLVIAPHANLTKNIGVNGAHSFNHMLNFDYGLLDIDNIQHPQLIAIDGRMNELFLLEHKLNKKIIFVKKILLKLSLYKIVKILLRIYKNKKRV
jgi:hypothetical protein